MSDIPNLAPYQQAVIEVWISEALAQGENREEAIARVLCAVADDQESIVRALFDARWPVRSEEDADV